LDECKHCAIRSCVLPSHAQHHALCPLVAAGTSECSNCSMSISHLLPVFHHQFAAFLVLFLQPRTLHHHIPCTCLIWSRLSLGYGPIVRSQATTTFTLIRRRGTALALNLFDRHLPLPSADVCSERTDAGHRYAAGTLVTTSAPLLCSQWSETIGQSLLVYQGMCAAHVLSTLSSTSPLR
jgi:hypothetical protein